MIPRVNWRIKKVLRRRSLSSIELSRLHVTFVMFLPVFKTGATVYFVRLYIIICSDKILTNWAKGVNADNKG